MKRNAVYGDRPPAFPSKEDLAAELSISVSTVDEWTRQGILPKPRRYKGLVRYCWAEVAVKLAPPTQAANLFQEALRDVT